MLNHQPARMIVHPPMRTNDPGGMDTYYIMPPSTYGVPSKECDMKGSNGTTGLVIISMTLALVLFGLVACVILVWRVLKKVCGSIAIARVLLI